MNPYLDPYWFGVEILLTWVWGVKHGDGPESVAKLDRYLAKLKRAG